MYKIEFVSKKLTRVKQDFIISFYVLKIIYFNLLKSKYEPKSFDLDKIKISIIDV